MHFWPVHIYPCVYICDISSICIVVSLSLLCRSNCVYWYSLSNLWFFSTFVCYGQKSGTISVRCLASEIHNSSTLSIYFPCFSVTCEHICTISIGQPISGSVAIPKPICVSYWSAAFCLIVQDLPINSRISGLYFH